MASTSVLLSLLLLLLVVLLPSYSSSPLTSTTTTDEDVDLSRLVKGCPFDSIYSFGGSSSDNGNLYEEEILYAMANRGHVDGVNPQSHHHLHRNSDGLLILDYLASAFHLPSPNPYLKKDAKFKYGANFAVDGATALEAHLIKDRLGIEMPWATTNSSLSVQVDWFMTHLTSICSNPDECRKKLGRAVFLVGGIGSSDYYFAFSEHKTIEEVSATLIPYVVQSIKDALTRLINAGAVTLVVPGILPAGCEPSYLNMFHSDDPMNYGHSSSNKHCLKPFNAFSETHNNLLRKVLRELNIEYPHIQIVYADYYKAYMSLLRNHLLLGFKQDKLGKACCHITKEHYSWHTDCCSEPNKYIHWDGVHLTKEANKATIYGIIQGSFIHPKLNLPDIRNCIM